MGKLGYLISEQKYSAIWITVCVIDIYKEDDCFKNDNGKILYLLVSDSVVSTVYYQLLICFSFKQCICFD